MVRKKCVYAYLKVSISKIHESATDGLEVELQVIMG